MRDHDRARAHRVHLFEDVRGDDDGLLLGHALDHLAHDKLLVGVEAVRRLVHDQHLRIVEDSLREARTLAIALGERVDRLLRDGGQLRLLDSRLNLLLHLRAGKAANLGDEGEEVRHRHRSVGRRVFGQIPEAALRANGILDDIVAADLRGARRGRDEPGDHAHGGGLARAIRPEESKHFALLDGKGDAFDRLEGAEALFQVIDLEHVSCLFFFSLFSSFVSQLSARTRRPVREKTAHII